MRNFKPSLIIFSIYIVIPISLMAQQINGDFKVCPGHQNNIYSYNVTPPAGQIPNHKPNPAPYWTANWTVVRGNSQANTGNGIQLPHIIDWDNICADANASPRAKISVTTTVHYLHPQTGNLMSKDWTAVELVEIIEKLPSSGNIQTQHNVIECYDQAPFNVTTSVNHCEGYKYIWTVEPSTWSFIDNGSSIDVTPDGINPGIIKCKVGYVSPCNGFQPLNLPDLTIQRDCPQDIPYVNPTSSLRVHNAAHNSVTVIPTSGKIEVLNGDQVRFKAGSYIKIEPNFHAHQGSLFTAKIKPCNNNCKALRMAKSDDNSENEPIWVESESPFEMVVCPNPSNGIYKLSFDGNLDGLEGMSRVVITNVSGMTVFETQISNYNIPQVIDISNAPPGFYVISVLTNQGSYGERLVKE